MAKPSTVFVCSNCGNESSKWFGRCPACNEWNTCYEEKINLYYDRKNDMSFPSIKSKYGINKSGVEYLVRLIDKHGFDILRTNENKSYSSKEKERILNRILIDNESILSVSIDEGLAAKGMLNNWLKKYRENGYNILERKRGCPTMKKRI